MSKKDAIIELLNKLFSDTSVSKDKTRQDLEELREEINAFLDALGE